MTTTLVKIELPNRIVYDIVKYPDAIVLYRNGTVIVTKIINDEFTQDIFAYALNTLIDEIEKVINEATKNE